ncbi:hypothetical protein MATL_G00247630 [Megalops atlanticus]|uniref:Uncharacterized protein n=1 Tax=Megalops atlanticus TaxID=7932 RepID=A0A9D3SV42_MEGAT|nr:hypothetical protein MATL_G00247630 [Megalops atlanticus]
MSMFGYRKELDKYEDLDEDELLASLTAEELQELEKELADIEPDSNVPLGLRQRDQTDKTPTGTFSREALLKYWENETRKLLEEERMGSSPKQDNEAENDNDKSEEECVTESNSETSEEEASEKEEDEEEEDEEDESEQEEDEAVTEDEDGDGAGDGDQQAESSKEDVLKRSSPQHSQNICNGLSKDLPKQEEEHVKKALPIANGDPELKVTPSRPCGNPTVVDECLEKILSNDADTTEVNLNNIENVSQETLIRFAEALTTNTHVRVFSLANTRADDQVAFAIAKMLRENSCVTNLNIESNYITGRASWPS